MNSQSKGGTLNRFTLLAVLQAILLVSTLVLLPAQAIALEPEPTRKVADPKPAVQAAPEPGPRKTAPEKILRIFPVELVLTVGESKPVSAWVCLKDGTTRNDEDWEPKADAACALRQDVKWSLKDAGVASFVEKQGEKTRVAAATVADTKIIAKFNGLTAKIDLQIEPAAQKKQAKPAPAKPAGEPKAEKKQAKPAPQVQKKQAKPAPAKPAGEPKAEKKQAKQSVQPVSDQAPAARKQAAQRERKTVEPVVDASVVDEPVQAAQRERKTVQPVAPAVDEPVIAIAAEGSINKVYQHWADEDAEWNNNILSVNKSDYFEGEVIPHVFVYKASNSEPLTNGELYTFAVVYNYYQANTNAGGFAYMTTYNLDRQPGDLGASGITPTIDGTFTGGGNQGVFYTVDANITNATDPACPIVNATKSCVVGIEFEYTGTTTTSGLAEIYYGLYVAEPGQVPTQGSGETDGASAWTGGSLQTTVTVDGTGATSLQLNPAAIIRGEISGIKYHDLNGNGDQDTGEPPLEDWTIQLCADSACSMVLETDLTDASGAYSFSVTPDAIPSTPDVNDPYYLREILETGWSQTEPVNPKYYGPFTVTADTPTFAHNDFGNTQAATKSGTKFEDLDADGAAREAGEPGLPGWTIYVDYDDSGTLDAGEPFAVTGADGSYQISGIDPGTYKVHEVNQAGWTCSFPDPCYYEETFASGDAPTGNDFGNYTTATKSGTKFEDLDADGAAREAGEPGLPGWTIYVDYDDSGTLDAGEPFAVTGADGSYQISGVDPGTYKVHEVNQAGWTCSFPDPCYYEETFASGDAPTGNDFGNYTTATKSGTKFEDLDADGAAREAGEPGLPGWTIYVDYDDSGTLDAGEPFAVTGADGSYQISGVDPGTYKVHEVNQAGWTCSFPDPCYYEETFASGDAPTGNDFGNYTTATKSGTKFEDLDADGAAREAGEPGLPGWTIYVDYDDSGTLDAGEPFAVTGADGSYQISGVDPGTYKVHEVNQAGWTCSFPDPCYYEETFASGDAPTGNDFGNYTTATKSGTKFEDLDADGAAREAGEPGLPGWTIYVDYDDSGTLDAGEPFAVTGADGSYQISGVDPGTYKVHEVNQAGWTCSFPDPCYYEETFASGDAPTGNDFGNYTTATKSGTKFEDLDADGAAREAGEPGLPGWTIYVDYDDSGTLDAGEPFAVTGADGSYQISGIDPGTYKVHEVNQAGWTCSFPDPCYYEETFASGDAPTGNDFGNYTTATKSGTKFEDLDADGAAREAGEPGLPGWTIYVDYDDSGTLDAGEPFAVTGADGSYQISGVDPGTYKVHEVNQAGWTCSFPDPCYYEETFASGDAPTGNDFGNYTTATKSGTKFEDLDADGAAREAGEPGLPGWTIYVDYDDSGTLDAGEPFAVTGADGSYQISGIDPGTYKVHEVNQAGWTCSFPDPCYYEETFASGDAPTGNDFGNYTTATKSGTKFEDLDADGAAREAGEPGLPGWTIYVDYDDSGTLDAGEPFAVTGADGSYQISGVDPGTYKVHEVNQAGWTCSFPDPCYYLETFASGDAPTGNDFGNYRLATKSGTKFEDLDADGTKDAGEPGVPGVEIYLRGTDGAGNAVDLTTTTDADGNYSFDVNPGDYLVCEQDVSGIGWLQSYPTNTVCSGETGTEAGGWDIILTSFEQDTGNDFGNYRLATKSGTKFEDLDADGTKDAGEPGVPGVEIYLRGTDGAGNAVDLTTTTDADGNYSFDVNPGDYLVCEQDVSGIGWLQSYPTNTVCSGETGTEAGGWDIILTSFEQDTGNDFGNYRLATKSGTKFEDLDADGTKDAGEPGVPGVEIYLRGTDGAGNAVDLTTTTDADGNYSFDVNPGDYLVCEQDVSGIGWLQSYPTNTVCSGETGTEAGGWDIILTSFEQDTGNDFGNYRLATKSGTKFEDLDADGTKDAGEPGVPGVEIYLRGTDGAGNAVDLTTTTDADGNYSFDVNPGDYLVCEQDVSGIGWLQSYPTNTVCSGETGTEAGGWDIILTSFEQDTGNDFGNYRLATKSGTKFEDLDADGTKDAGEPGVPGVEIYLRGTDGAGNAVDLTTTTDADGNYSFDVNPGDYLVCEQDVSGIGWLQSYPTNTVCSGETGTEAGGWDIILTSFEQDTGNDFGNYRLATKSGTKFEDLDADGTKDAGEPGVPGVEIYLRGTDGAGNAVDLTTTTDADGNYSFDVNPGDYLVCEQDVSGIGWLQSYPTNTVCSGETGTEAGGWDIILTSFEQDTGNDFGNYRLATKSGTKFEDLDADGTKDAGEPGVPGVEIYLRGTDGAGNAVDLTTTTDADGNYSFDVNPGDYLVCEQDVSGIGWLQSYPTNTVCSGETGTEAGGWDIILTSFEQDTGNDFGNYRLATKSGTKFEDLDADGTKDAGEPGVPGVEIYLRGTDGAGNAVDLTTTTDADGNYSFDVNPGDYLVCEQDVSGIGWLQSYPTNTVCSGETGTEAGGWDIILTSFEQDTGNDFGNYRLATKSGTKFEDLDADGTKDAGEPGVPGVEIYLRGTDGAGNAVDLTTTTDADGNYSFDVNPGDYLVCEQDVSGIGWLQSYPTNTVCSGETGTEAGGWDIILTSFEQDTGNDFGNYRLATKSGTKFEDLDADGDLADGVPVEGVTINLILASDNSIVATDVTDANGEYSFESAITPGIDYLVCESTVSPTWLQTYPANTVCSDVTGMEAGGWAINLESNEDDTGNDFGNHRLVPEVTIDKTVTSGPTLTGTSGTLDYEVAVANVGPIDTTYTLTDTPTFGAGITIDRIAVAAPTPPVSIDPYSSGDPIVTDEAIGVGVTHTYTVTIDFTVTGESTSADLNCALGEGEAGTGSLNTATVTYSGGTIEDDACAPVPGGGGGGAGGGQPPTDMLAPTASLTAATEAGGPLEGAINWAIWVLLSAALILSAGWVIRRQRFSEI